MTVPLRMAGPDGVGRTQLASPRVAGKEVRASPHRGAWRSLRASKAHKPLPGADGGYGFTTFGSPPAAAFPGGLATVQRHSVQAPLAAIGASPSPAKPLKPVREPFRSADIAEGSRATTPASARNRPDPDFLRPVLPKADAQQGNQADTGVPFGPFCNDALTAEASILLNSLLVPSMPPTPFATPRTAAQFPQAFGVVTPPADLCPALTPASAEDVSAGGFVLGKQQDRSTPPDNFKRGGYRRRHDLCPPQPPSTASSLSSARAVTCAASDRSQRSSADDGTKGARSTRPWFRRPLLSVKTEKAMELAHTRLLRPNRFTLSTNRYHSFGPSLWILEERYAPTRETLEEASASVMALEDTSTY